MTPMVWRIRRSVVVGFGAAALALALPRGGGVAAQEVPRSLTLNDAVRIAQTRNPAHIRAVNRLETAAIEERRGFNNAFLPRFNSGLQFRGSTFRQYVTADFVGEPLEIPYYSRAESSTTSQSVGFVLDLFSGPNLMRYRSARAGTRNTAAQVDAETFRIRAAVARRYYGAVQADAAVALEERLVESAREHLDATERMFGIGVARLEDVLGARLEIVSRENGLETARGNAHKARLALFEAMGVADDPELELAEGLPEPFDPDDLDGDEIVAVARLASPRIRQREAALTASEATLRATRAVRWPTIQGSGSLNRGRTVQGFDAFYDLNPREWGYVFGLQVNVPIPVLQFNTSADIASAQVQVMDAREDLREARLAVEAEVRSAVIDLRQGYGDLLVARQQADLSIQRVELQEERLRAGSQVSFVELEQLRERAAQAERAVLAAVIAFQNNLLALDELLAREVRP